MAPPAGVIKGSCKWFQRRKGYGFVTDEDGNDYFVHQSSLKMDGFRALEEGEAVEFEVGHEKDRECAIKVTGPGGVNCGLNVPKKKRKPKKKKQKNEDEGNEEDFGGESANVDKMRNTPVLDGKASKSLTGTWAAYPCSYMVLHKNGGLTYNWCDDYWEGPLKNLKVYRDDPDGLKMDGNDPAPCNKWVSTTADAIFGVARDKMFDTSLRLTGKLVPDPEKKEGIVDYALEVRLYHGYSKKKTQKRRHFT